MCPKLRATSAIDSSAGDFAAIRVLLRQCVCFVLSNWEREDLVFISLGWGTMMSVEPPNMSVHISGFIQHHGVLDLLWNKLSGNIPPQIGNCAVVVELILAGNQFTGSVPSDLVRITNLTTLDLSCNSLLGEIPPGVGSDAHKLQGINLAFNNFTGLIPAEFGNLTSLVNLNLTGNHFSGSIPESLGNLSISLLHLDVSDNQLTGNIPSSLAQLVSIVDLNLQQNRLTGTIEALLSKSLIWHQMQTLNVSNNLLGGQIPTIIGNLEGLSFLDLSNNFFNGSIPGDEIGNLTQLIYLDLSSNHITREIPLELCNLFELNFLNVSDNSLLTYLFETKLFWLSHFGLQPWIQTVPDNNSTV